MSKEERRGSGGHEAGELCTLNEARPDTISVLLVSVEDLPW
jgi:hypothetical protein